MKYNGYEYDDDEIVLGLKDMVKNIDKAYEDHQNHQQTRIRAADFDDELLEYLIYKFQSS